MDIDNTVLRKMALLAVNASIPVGMGFLQYSPTNYELGDIPEPNGNYYSIDYFQGRMTKFYAKKTGETWEFLDTPQSDYQSWSRKYPTYESLYKAAKES